MKNFIIFLAIILFATSISKTAVNQPPAIELQTKLTQLKASLTQLKSKLKGLSESLKALKLKLKPAEYLWTNPTVKSKINFNDFHIPYSTYNAIIGNLKNRLPRENKFFDKIQPQVTQKASNEPLTTISLAEIKKELNNPAISDNILFYEAAILSGMGRPAFYNHFNENASIQELDEITKTDPLFNFNFETYPEIDWTIKNQIQQLPALYQSYTRLAGKDKYNTSNSFVLCGFYATYFAETFLTNSNNFGELINKLNDRSIFDKKYKAYFEGIQDAGWLPNDHIETLVQSLSTKNSIVVGVQVNFSNQDKVEAFKKAEAENDSISIITQPWTGNHWYAIFAQKINNKLTFAIADSLGIDRRNDKRTKAWYDLLSGKD